MSPGRRLKVAFAAPSMPTLLQLIPPSDLLSQIGGIEQGLRRGKRLRVAGLLLAASQAVILVANNEWLKALVGLDWSQVADQLWLLAPLFFLFVALFLTGWARVWLKESRAPFRYTFSVAPFEPMADGTPETQLGFLRDDLLERISTRIPRLSRLDEPPAVTAPADSPNGRTVTGNDEEPISHIHVSGAYAKRVRPPQLDALLEVTAWVRIGSASAPSNLAHPVKFSLRAARDRAVEGASGPGGMTDQQYEEVLERVFFSVASEIYKRIQSDVRRKIELLPRRYFRAVAYFHEAEDYGRSNTLDAYDEAQRLYGDALRTYDPTWGTPWSPRARARPLRRTRHAATFGLQRTRRLLSHVWHRLGRIEILIARAHLGYANALLYRRILASQLGMSQNPIFETRPIAQRALKRLTEVSPEVPGRDDSLFEAHVTLAFAFDQLGWAGEAEKQLGIAKSLDPARSNHDPRYLFAAALLEHHLLGSLRLLRRTVELEHSFEAAHFELARRMQTLWESQQELERNVAGSVASEYTSVLALNPGNLAAWANRAYMSWLLGGDDDLADAREGYESGRQYKEIAREAFVVSIDWGLARVAAESGDFEAAYTHYINAVSALVAQGRSYDQFQYTAQQVEPINDAVLKRFGAYRKKVETAFKSPPQGQLARTTERVRCSVMAFVHNDYGWACQQYYNRTGDERKLADARKAYQAAIDSNEDFALAYYNLHFASLDEGGRDAASDGRHWLDKVHQYEPTWPEANLLLLTRWMEDAQSSEREARRHANEATRLLEEAREERKKAEAGLREPLVQVADGANEPAGRSRIQRGAAEARASVHEVKRAGIVANAQLLRAREEQRRAEALSAKRDEFREWAGKLAPALLPQEWLWQDDDFNWDIVTRRSKASACKRNLIWERSFDDFQARALFQWGRGRCAAGEHLEALDAVFEVISRAFWPSDVDLLREQRRLAEHLEKATREYDDRIQVVVQRWVKADASYWTLRWLTDDAFLSSDEGKRMAARELQRAAEHPNLTPRFRKWLADQLRQLADQIDGQELKPAVATYHRAAEDALDADDHSLLVEVVETLEEIEGPDFGEELYERVLECQEPSSSVLAKVGSWFAGRERWERASDAMRRALERDPDPEEEPAYRCTYARSLWAQQRYGEAIEQLATVDSQAAFGADWRSSLAYDLETERTAARSRLREWLAPRQREAIANDSGEEAVDAGRALLVASLARREAVWKASPDEPDGDAPLAVPALLTADARLFDGGATADELKRQMNEMLDRIAAERGLSPPTTVVSAAGLPQRYYLISLTESPVESGRVPPEVEDTCAYMLDRLEEVVRRNLVRFVDTEMVDALLARWEASVVEADGEDAAEWAEGRRRALPDERARRRFAQVVRELVREGVSVRRIGLILKVGVDGPLFECVERARKVLRDDLPTDGRRIVAMPAETEAVLIEWWKRNRCRSLTLPEELDRKVAEQVAPYVRANGDGRDPNGSAGPAALVVQAAAIRPFAARLVERHFPGVPVLSSDERPVDAEQGRFRWLAARAVGP